MWKKFTSTALLVLLLSLPLSSLSAQSDTIPESQNLNQNSESIDSSLLALSTDSLQIIDQLAQNSNNRNEILLMLSKLSPEQLQYLKVALPLIVNFSPFLTMTESYLNDSAEILPKVYDLLQKDLKAKTTELLIWKGATVAAILAAIYFISH